MLIGLCIDDVHLPLYIFMMMHLYGSHLFTLLLFKEFNTKKMNLKTKKNLFLQISRFHAPLKSYEHHISNLVVDYGMERDGEYGIYVYTTLTIYHAVVFIYIYQTI